MCGVLCVLMCDDVVYASLEDMVSLWSEVICLLPGKEACRAICVAMDVFTGTKQSLKEQGKVGVAKGCGACDIKGVW